MGTNLLQVPKSILRFSVFSKLGFFFFNDSLQSGGVSSFFEISLFLITCYSHCKFFVRPGKCFMSLYPLAIMRTLQMSAVVVNYIQILLNRGQYMSTMQKLYRAHCDFSLKTAANTIICIVCTMWITIYFGFMLTMNRCPNFFHYASTSLLVVYELKIRFICIYFIVTLYVIERQVVTCTRILRPSHSKLETIINKVSDLLRAAKALNAFFSPQLLMCYLMMGNMAVTSSSNVIKVLFDSLPKRAILPSINSLTQFVFFVCIAHSCESFNRKAEDFNNELFKMMRESKDLCNNEKLHLYVTMKQSLLFTACGFFTIGYPLVTSIIAAATTYLVILVQFSMSDK